MNDQVRLWTRSQLIHHQRPHRFLSLWMWDLCTSSCSSCPGGGRVSGAGTCGSKLLLSGSWTCWRLCGTRKTTDCRAWQDAPPLTHMHTHTHTYTHTGWHTEAHTRRLFESACQLQKLCTFEMPYLHNESAWLTVKKYYLKTYNQTK